jgi:hypothetical protein
MITVLLLAGATLAAIVLAAVRVRRTRQEMDGLPTQVLGLSWLDTEEVKGDLQPSRIQPASGRNSQKTVPRDRLSLAVSYMRGDPAARELLERVLDRKPVRIKTATDDDPNSGSSGSAATAITHVNLEPRRWPPGRPERS